jgi:hypothetical protein
LKLIDSEKQDIETEQEEVQEEIKEEIINEEVEINNKSTPTPLF